MPWLNTTTSADKKVKSRKIKVSPVIVNDIFHECSQLIDDEYWRDTLVSMSYNKIPKGFMYKDGYLTHKKGNKTQNIQIPESPIDALRLILSFMRSTAGMRSSQDKLRDKRLEEEATVEYHERTWEELKDIKRCLPDMYISNYIRWISKSLQLTQSECNQLKTLINLGILFKYIDDSHIRFDHTIQSIDGLVFDDRDRTFHLNLPKIPIPKDKSKYKGSDEIVGKRYNCISFLQLWVKYIEGLNKYRNNKIFLNVHDLPSSL
jgi:hypothetical protein